MRRKERAAALDDSAAVGLEGIGNIIVSDAEEYLHEVIGQSVQNQFETGVINYAATFHETTAKYTVGSLI